MTFRSIFCPPILALSAALSACTSSGTAGNGEVNYQRSRAELARQLAGREAGAPVDCIAADRATAPAIYGDDTILYRDGPTLWRASPVGTCPGLRPNVTLIVERWGSQLCRNDQFRTIEPGVSIPSANCRFDRFIPYRRVQR